jgi:activator of 2-hydroxyglutaryl-CoA dehydratase
LGKLDAPVKFSEPIVIIVSGGTSKPKNFVKLFEQCLEEKKHELTFEVKEVRHAKEPLDAVARGCLLASQLEYE